MLGDFITKKTYRVDFGETLSMGNFQSIRPALSQAIEYDPRELPEGMTVETVEAAFKEKVRQEYFQLKMMMIQDFKGFAKQM